MRFFLLGCVLMVAAAAADDNPAFNDSESAWYLARKGKTAELQALVAGSPEHLNKLDQLQRSPLFYAAKSGRTETVAYLLAREDVRVDGLDQYGKTAWHWAAAYGHLGVLKEMQRHKINPDLVDKDGRSALFIAFGNAFSNAHGRHAKVVGQLLQAGANPNLRDKQGETPLFASLTLVGRADAMAVLLADKRVEVNARNKRGDTALHMAAAGGFVDRVQLLVAAGADTRQKNADGETPVAKMRQQTWYKQPARSELVKQLEALLSPR